MRTLLPAKEDEVMMINFFNDHLVSPVLCDILYQTIPEHLHIPVVFLRSPTNRQPGEFYSIGVHIFNEPHRIEIYLNAIFDVALRKHIVKFGVLPFREWYLLLSVSYHEFGHHEDRCLNGLFSGNYRSGTRQYENAESRAEAYAERMIAHLAEMDHRLFQPRWLGYLSIRTDHLLSGLKKWKHVRWAGRARLLRTLRSIKSGGQLTTGDVALAFQLYTKIKAQPMSRKDQIPNAALIRRVACDLGHIYLDRAGRRHLLFDYGDLGKIARRIEGHHVRAGGEDGSNQSCQL